MDICNQEQQLRTNKNTIKSTPRFKWFTPNQATSTVLSQMFYCSFNKFSNRDVQLMMITIEEKENREQRVKYVENQRENEGMKAMLEYYVFSPIYCLQGLTLTNDPNAKQETKQNQQENNPAPTAKSASLWPGGKPTRLSLLPQNINFPFKFYIIYLKLPFYPFLKYNILTHDLGH